jgi:hypothetical protein
MGTQVYSWRLSSELKSDLEREARARKASVSSILDSAAREWLKKSGAESANGGEQARLHAAAAACIGAFAGRNPRRAERARDTVRARLAKRHAR